MRANTANVVLTIATKAASVELYREHVGGPWADYLAALYEQGKRRWGYQIPETVGDRAALRILCRHYLAFENHYFARYRRFLLDTLRRDDPASRRYAAARLGEIHYPDEEVRAAHCCPDLKPFRTGNSTLRCTANCAAFRRGI